jgi:hypothetical protein
MADAAETRMVPPRPATLFEVLQQKKIKPLIAQRLPLSEAGTHTNYWEAKG